MLISVLVTTYNAEKTIHSTLDSIADQSYKDFEIIVVDDGSCDSTPRKVNDWIKENCSININFYQPGRLGRGKALNYGVNKAKGEWIAICDADDLWHPEKLLFQIKILKQKNDISLLATDYKIISAGSTINKLKGINKNKFIIENVSINELLRKNIFCHSSIIVDKTLCKYDTTLDSQFDLDLYLRLLDSGNVLSIIKLPLTGKRLHSNQSFEAGRNFNYRINSFKLVYPYIQKYKLYKIIPMKLLRVLVGFMPKTIRNILSKTKRMAFV